MSARRDWRTESSGPTSETMRARVLAAEPASLDHLGPPCPSPGPIHWHDAPAGATGFESPDDGRWIGALLDHAPPVLDAEIDGPLTWPALTVTPNSDGTTRGESMATREPGSAGDGRPSPPVACACRGSCAAWALPPGRYCRLR